MDKLHLKEKKVRILKDFLARFPYILDNTYTCDIIIQRLIGVSMLDTKHKLWPYFHEILKTNRISITRYGMQMIEIFFSIVQNHVGDRSHI